MAEFSRGLGVIEQLHHIYIIQKLIPQMEIRRAKIRGESSEIISEKLNRLSGSGKQGEWREFEEQIRRDVTGLDGEFASETADLYYYCAQKNCPKNEIRQMHDWFQFLGIPLRAAQEFCILKYRTRIRYGDRIDYKKIENRALDKYINLHYPELKNIWQGSTLT